MLGDLLTTLERSKRAVWDPVAEEWDLRKAQVVSLPYSKRKLFVPDNVLVIATMNTTDRSVAPLDAALRRRFAFRRMWPMGWETTGTAPDAERAQDLPKEIWEGARGSGSAPAAFVSAVSAWIELNTALQRDIGVDGMLGHSYLFDLARALSPPVQSRPWHAAKAPNPALVVTRHWNSYILPQLADVLVSNSRLDVLGVGDSRDGGGLLRPWIDNHLQDLTPGRDGLGFVPILRWNA